MKYFYYYYYSMIILGCILAVEKRITSPLIVTSSIEKVFEVDG